MTSLVIDKELHLELLEEFHAQTVHKQVEANRQHLRHWLPWVDESRTLEDTYEFIAQSQRLHQEGRGAQFAIFSEQQLTGIVGINDISRINRRGAIGYWQAADFEGQGIMTRSVARILRYGFEELGLHKLEIYCATANHRSQVIPQRLGFHYEGILRSNEWLYDHFVDHQLYSLLNDEWQAMICQRSPSSKPSDQEIPH